MAKVSFKAQVLQAREDAIVSSVNRLLAEKGFDAMTVDEVAADVGIAKASLYKHFTSKEELAAAAMIRVLDHALAFIATLEAQPKARPIDQLKAVVRWTMQVQLAGEMPSLPAQNSTLRCRADGQQDLPRPTDRGERQTRRLDHRGPEGRPAEPQAAARGRALHAVRARLRPGAGPAQGRAATTATSRSSRCCCRLVSTAWPALRNAPQAGLKAAIWVRATAATSSAALPTS